MPRKKFTLAVKKNLPQEVTSERWFLKIRDRSTVFRGIHGATRRVSGCLINSRDRLTENKFNFRKLSRRETSLKTVEFPRGNVLTVKRPSYWWIVFSVENSVPRRRGFSYSKNLTSPDSPVKYMLPRGSKPRFYWRFRLNFVEFKIELRRSFWVCESYTLKIFLKCGKFIWLLCSIVN